MGRTLLRLLLHLARRPMPYPMRGRHDDLHAEELRCKQGAVALLEASAAAVAGEPPAEVRRSAQCAQQLDADCLPPPCRRRQLWAFGVLISLCSCWDGEYTDATNNLRAQPRAAAAALAGWHAVLTSWRVCSGRARLSSATGACNADMIPSLHAA